MKSLLTCLLLLLAPACYAEQAEVLHFSKLLPLLPAAPEGWTADKPEGSTVEGGEFKITTAQCTYSKGEAEDAPLTTISIIDCANNQQYFDLTTAAWNISSETTEGYDKAVTIDGNRGFEHYQNEGKSGSIWAVVGKRFFVQIEVQNQPPAALQEWIARLDLKKLAELQ